MSSYIEGLLSPGETIQIQARTTLWPALIWLVIGLLTVVIFIGFFFLIVALLFFIRAKTTELAVTNKKVVGKWGLIRRDSIELLLPKVEAVRVQQGLFGRMLNFGTIVVSGAGNSTPIPMIIDPLDFRRKFTEIQEQSTKGGA